MTDGQGSVKTAMVTGERMKVRNEVGMCEMCMADTKVCEVDFVAT